MTSKLTGHEFEVGPLLWEPPARDPIVDARLSALKEGAQVIAAPYGPCEIEGTGKVTHLAWPAREGEVGEVVVAWETVGEEMHVAIPDGESLVVDGLELFPDEILRGSEASS